MDDSVTSFLRQRRVGLALSGGGARGFAHVGVLRALEVMGIRPSVMAGVSVGSIVAVLYGSGLSANELFEHFKSVGMADLTDLAIPKNGFFKLTKLRDRLRRLLPTDQLEELAIPTVVCATDFDRCLPHKFESGSIGESVMASCSIPIVFQPVKIDGTTYIDGGATRNLPAWAIRDRCDVLIGVNVSPMPQGRYKNTLPDIALRAYDLMVRGNAAEDVALCDIAIQPQAIATMGIFNLRHKRELIKRGYQETIEKINKYLQTNAFLTE